MRIQVTATVGSHTINVAGDSLEETFAALIQQIQAKQTETEQTGIELNAALDDVLQLAAVMPPAPEPPAPPPQP